MVCAIGPFPLDETNTLERVYDVGPKASRFVC